MIYLLRHVCTGHKVIQASEAGIASITSLMESHLTCAWIPSVVWQPWVNNPVLSFHFWINLVFSVVSSFVRVNLCLQKTTRDPSSFLSHTYYLTVLHSGQTQIRWQLFCVIYLQSLSVLCLVLKIFWELNIC